MTDRFHSMQTEGFVRRFLDKLLANHVAAPDLDATSVKA